MNNNNPIQPILKNECGRTSIRDWDLYVDHLGRAARKKFAKIQNSKNEAAETLLLFFHGHARALTNRLCKNNAAAHDGEKDL